MDATVIVVGNPLLNNHTDVSLSHVGIACVSVHIVMTTTTSLVHGTHKLSANMAILIAS